MATKNNTTETKLTAAQMRKRIELLENKVQAMIELINQDKVSFTAPYDNKGYLTIFDVDEEKLSKEKERISKELRKQKLNEKEFESKLSDELGKIQSVNTKTVKLACK